MKKILTNYFYFLKHVQTAVPMRILVGMLISVVSVAANILTGVFMLKIVLDNLVAQLPFEDTIYFILFCFAFLLFKWILQAWHTYVYIPKAELKTYHYMQLMLFEKVKQVDLCCYDNPQYYNQYIHALHEADMRATAVYKIFINFFTNVISIFSLLAVILWLNPLVIVFSAVTVFLSIYLATHKNKVSYQYYQESLSIHRKKDYIKRIYYLQQYAKEFKILGIGELLLKKFETSIHDLFFKIKQYGFRLTRLEAAVSLTQGASMFGTIIYITVLVFYRILTIGDFSALLNASQTFAQYAQGVFSIYSELQNQNFYIEKFKGFLDMQAKIENSTNGIKLTNANRNGSIRLQNLYFQYPNTGKMVLRDISMEFPYGKKIAIVGPNGCGKSTLVKLLFRLYDPDKGDIIYKTLSYPQYDVISLRKNIGIIFQDYQYFAITIAENVLLREPKNAQDELLVWDCLDKSGLAQRVKMLENGINTYVTQEFDDSGVVFSGGELQKLALARVFAQDYGILILDEPSSSLDAQAEHDFFQNVMLAAKDKTVIFISHRLSNACMADIIYYIENGAIAEMGTHQELITQGGKYAQMFSLQAEQYMNAPLHIHQRENML